MNGSILPCAYHNAVLNAKFQELVSEEIFSLMIEFDLFVLPSEEILHLEDFPIIDDASLQTLYDFDKILTKIFN